MESWLFLGAVFGIAALSKNKALMIGVGFVMVLKLVPLFHPLLKLMQAQGINWGVTIISAAIMVPIATGEITVSDLLNVMKTPAAGSPLQWGCWSRCCHPKGSACLPAIPK